MTPLLIAIFGLPLAGIGIVTTRFGYRAQYVIPASVAGEVIGMLLFIGYNNWKASRVLSGREGGAVLYLGPAPPGERIQGILLLLLISISIALLFMFAHWLYVRVWAD